MNLLLACSTDREGETLRIQGRRGRHLCDVLRVTVGDRITVGMVGEGKGSAEVLSIVDDCVVLGDLQLEIESCPPRVRLVVALPRPKALCRVLQTAASFGIKHIDLINAWRVEKNYWHSPVIGQERMRGELWLGCEQGRHVWLPSVAVHRYFLPFVESLAGNNAERRLLAHPGAKRWLRDMEPETGVTTIAVGPEGGWIASELTSFAEVGFVPISISRSILRTEIAIAATLAQWELFHR